MEYKKALNKAAQLCSESEKCEQDIREKLRAWEVSDRDADKIIAYLEKEKFIDEGRFTAFFVRDKFRFNKWGKIKIGYALRQKHISQATITEALQAIDEEEYSSALQEVLQSKKRGLKYANEYDLHNKLTRFAVGRGFEYEAISRIDY
ncbi:MAG: RecX family transcriptional regulator [Prevotellaceae bacterium]|jgi:regulatory protein|nr:RecX family transcriptional regulator [Prevotellaceae bacterium]